MIHLRLAFGKDQPIQKFDVEDGEVLAAAIKRALTEVPLNGRKPEEVFHTVLNGCIIDSSFWSITTLKPSDILVISPKIESGDSGQIFKQILILAVAIVASIYLTPAGGATFLSAFEVAGITIGASLLLNALIPPPVLPGFGDFGGGGGGIESSQMYTFTGQSNQAKRYGNVPRVYGTFRMFPNVAAIPYIQLEVDPVNGELYQYLYVIYDFGLGPMGLADFKIGDTPLSAENFQSFAYRLVDPNRPTSPEGFWDDQTWPSFDIYKGDNEGDAFSIAINANSSDGGDSSLWEFTRNSAVNSDSVAQEIFLNFVCPSGLYGYSATGVLGGRQINLEIAFRLVGGDGSWHDYNNPDVVDKFTSAGGNSESFDYVLRFLPPDASLSTYYESTVEYNYNNQYSEGLDIALWQIADGQTNIIVEKNENLQVGAAILLMGQRLIGYVESIHTYTNPLYMRLTLDREIHDSEPIGYVLSNTTAYPGLSQDAYIHTSSATFGRAQIFRQNAQPVYAMYSFQPKVAGQYEIRVRRVNTSSNFTTQVQDNLTWTSIVTRFDRNPVQTDKRHVFMELKIKATGQINGNIDNLSAVCNSVLDIYDPDAMSWSKDVTNNPAWIFCDLLTGEINKKSVAKSRLHMDSIVEWADFCDAVPTPPEGQDYTFSRFQCNFILDYQTTLQAVVQQVTSSAQASLNIIDGKYGVLIDKLKTTPVQIFTPRNSKNFNSNRVYGPRPHALNVNFIDPNLNWDMGTLVVYDDGYTADNATVFEDMTTFGVINNEQAWRFGRYMIAQNKLRQETISILVDFEYLICTRGDYVQITQDVMRVGGRPARVKTVVSSTVTIDDALDIDLMLSYGYTFRGADGIIVTDTLTPTDPSTFDLDGTMPAVGDLIIIGEVGNITFDCIVKSISPNDDLSAQLLLIEKADAIYSAESTGTLPDYNPQFSDTSNPNVKPPNAVENLIISDSGYQCPDSGALGYDYFADLIWDAPSKSIYEFFAVYVDASQGYKQVATTNERIYVHHVDPLRLGFEHSFKVLAVSATGKKLGLGQVSAVSYTPVAKTTPPSDVAYLQTDITNQMIQLSWPPISDCDVLRYDIRFSPNMDAVWSTSVPLLITDRKTTVASTQARTGTYLIKALDFGLNQSVNEAVAITSIPNLFDLNLIDTITDTPTWPGIVDGVVVTSEALYLQLLVSGSTTDNAYYPFGYYYISSILDLGDIYSVRLQAHIEAQGFTIGDLMAEWVTLSSVDALNTVVHPNWGVEAQYRSTNTFNAIGDWVTLSSISIMNDGEVENWTDWRPFIMGDATGRIFEFRVKLISYKTSVSPQVLNVVIRADMPDRIEAYQNLTATNTTGYVLTYSVPFAGPDSSPNIQVSIDGASSGDYWTISSKTLGGFTIKFYDKTDTQVARNFDVAVKGYGRKYTSVI